MKTVLLSKAVFATKRPLAQELIRDWASRECASFDELVRAKAEPRAGTGSIWEIPSIDSKRVVSLLTELEPLLGCRLPPTLIRRGGYTSVQDLEADLLKRIEQCCIDSSHPTGLARKKTSLPHRV